MRRKNSRIDAIRDILLNSNMGRQDDLLRELKKRGFNVTQATLSRDLKQMKVVKTTNSTGFYIYSLPEQSKYKRVSTSLALANAFRSAGIVSVQFSGNMGVVRTRAGYGKVVAHLFESGIMPEIIGAIADDNIVFIVVKSGIDQDALQEKIILATEGIIPQKV